MESYLLATKLQIPIPPRHAVPRVHLLDALAVGVPEHKLILLSAPAGYGKSTLLAQWAHSGQCPVAWLSLGDADNDAEVFLRYLLAAWSSVQPIEAESPLGMLLSAMSPSLEAVRAAFVNAASAITGHVAIILDDYQSIHEPAVHETLAFLLNHLPPMLHFVIASRGEPPLPLSRYRARHQLLELRAEDLQFDLAEAEEFFNRAMGVELPSDELAQYHARLEGWVAGMQLVALSRQRFPGNTAAFLMGENHRFIADFLSDDVLAALPEDTRQFLFQTSILEQMTGSLCDAVSGRVDGQAMLDELERKNLFLVPLDANRQWFRYHPLFAGFLQGELTRRASAEIATYHRSAARWLFDHDLPEQAFRHAVEGEDVEIVNQILERYFYVKMFSGELRVAQQWLNVLPEAWYVRFPVFGIHRAAFLVVSGDLEAAARRLAEVEEQLTPNATVDAHAQLARVSAIRCYIACFRNDLPRAEAYARQALRELPVDDFFFRADIYQALGDTYRGNRRWDEAIDAYHRVFDFDLPAFTFRLTHVYGALADLALMQGHLREAAAHWQHALKSIQDQQHWGRLPLHLIGWVYVRFGELLYEWNELDAAWDHLSRGLERAEASGDIRTQFAGYLLAGRIKLSGSDVAAAADYLEQARPLAEHAYVAEWTGRFERLQLALWLAQGQLGAATEWAQQVFDSHQVDNLPEREMTQLSVARLYIELGDAASLGEASTLLEELCRTAQAKGRISIHIEALALQALLYRMRRQTSDALMALTHALQRAEAEGYVRLFVDLGSSMARLLQEMRARGVLSAYVAKLLASFPTDLTSPLTLQGSLPEPLTPREQEVLELLAAGLTNPEIAEKLVVSPETVKKHGSSIYGKLGVHNRTQAVAKARVLGLLN